MKDIMTREEAIQIIRKNIPHLGIGATEMTDALEELIPQLRESEDERMMREFNDWLCEEIEWRTNDLRDEKDRKTLNMLCYVLKKFKDWPEKQKEQKEQKPAEWSEEDEKKIHFLSRLIEFQVKDGEYCFGEGACAISKQEAIEMLKSLRPSWKPSEEQMEGLKFFLEFHRSQRNVGTVNWREYDAIESLYKDLKKL